jgi:hypothetical protein
VFLQSCHTTTGAEGLPGQPDTAALQQPRGAARHHPPAAANAGPTPHAREGPACSNTAWRCARSEGGRLERVSQAGVSCCFCFISVLSGLCLMLSTLVKSCAFLKRCGSRVHVCGVLACWVLHIVDAVAPANAWSSPHAREGPACAHPGVKEAGRSASAKPG